MITNGLTKSMASQDSCDRLLNIHHFDVRQLCQGQVQLGLEYTPETAQFS